MAFPTPPSEPITEIATDTNYAVPGEDWDGEPTKVAPTTAIEEQGYVPGTPRPADVDNWLFNMIAKWLAYLALYVTELKDTYAIGSVAAVTDNAIVRFDGTGGKQLQASGLTITDAAEMGFVATKARTVVIGPDRFRWESGWSFDESNARVVSSANSAVARVTLDMIPEGATITSVLALVDPGAARTGTDRMRLDVPATSGMVFSGAESVGVGTLEAGPLYDDESTDLQGIGIASGGAIVAAKSAGYRYVRITAGNDAGTNFDHIYGVRVIYSDPGTSYR